MGRRGPGIVLSSALHLVQVLCALFLIAVVPWKLFEADGFSLSAAASAASDPNDALDDSFSCLLDTRTSSSSFLSGSSFCVAVIAFAVASLVLGAVVSCAKCVCKCATANVCGLSGLVTVVADLALAAAWGAAFVLILARSRDANEKAYPERGWRDAVVAASFFGAASYVLDALVVCCTAVGPSS